MNSEILIPIGLILVGGTLIYWIQYGLGENQNIWVLPWLFGTLVAGGYLGWFYLSGAPIWGRILFTIVGCVLGGICGVIGLITDPGIDEDPSQQYLTAMFLLTMPVGVIVGTQLGKIWTIPGPVVGFCLAPLLLSILSLLFISLPQKLFAWIKKQ